MKSKITVIQSDECCAKPEVDWEAFARTDGSAIANLEGVRQIFRVRKNGRWMEFVPGTAEFTFPCRITDDFLVASWLRTGVVRPINVEIRWSYIK